MLNLYQTVSQILIIPHQKRIVVKHGFILLLKVTTKQSSFLSEIVLKLKKYKILPHSQNK